MPAIPPRARAGLGHPVYDNEQAFRSLYRKVYKERLFHELPHHPKLIALFETLFQEEVLVHPRHIFRVQTPGSQRWSTPPHQDHRYICGSLNTWTSWIPLVDCPQELGGLMLQAGSHQNGFLATRPAEGAGGTVIDISDDNWLASDMKVGDVLLMHSLCIHQAIDNCSADQLRLSIDLRYQPRSEIVHPNSLRPHLNITDWDAVYERWPDDDPLRFYWREMDLTIQRPQGETP